ncbi:MAG: hypothetical protein AAF390_12550 [Pseudomonadota bacterium]
MALPDTRDLTRDGDVWEGDGPHVLTITADTCAATGTPLGDLAAKLAERQEYILVRDGVWQSTTWREPRIEVEARPDGYLVRETDLES